MRFFNLKRKNLGLFYGIIFLIFYFRLLYIFPYTGDDWGWGSQIGLDRLHNFFAGYNGRYLGNLLVLPLTRNILFKSIVITIFFVAIVLLTLSLMENKRNKTLFIFLSSFLLVFMPRGILAEGIVWASGFINYVPPIVLCLCYIVFSKRFLKDSYPLIHPLWIPIMVIIGFSASLFIEHVTIYNLLLSIFVLILVFIKFKKVYIVNIAYFIGSLLGTITMFSNSSYSKIFDGTYTGRTVGTTTPFSTMSYQLLTQGYKDLILNNFALNLSLIILFILIIMYSLYRGKKIALGLVLGIYMILYTISSGIFYFTYITKKFTLIFVDSSINTIDTIFFILTLIFFISLILAAIFFIEDKKNKFITLFLLGSIIVLTIPLLLVTPIGPRCFLPMYILFIVLTGVLLDNLTLLDKTLNISLIVFFIIVLGGMIRMYAIYTPIHKATIERNQVQSLQVKQGKTTIEIPANPPDGGWTNVWAWTPLPSWDYEYKAFYNIPSTDSIKVISYKEWKKIATHN